MKSRYNSGPKPSKHDHVGTMVFTNRDCYCTSCNQSWYLKIIEEKSGKTLTKWVPSVGGGW